MSNGSLDSTLSVDNLPPGAVRRVYVQGEPVCVANVGGSIYAVHDICTHARVSLSDGDLCGRQVVCPWHGAMFDMKTGRATCGPADAPVQCYSVRIEDGRIVVEPREQAAES